MMYKLWMQGACAFALVISPSLHASSQSLSKLAESLLVLSEKSTGGKIIQQVFPGGNETDARRVIMSFLCLFPVQRRVLATFDLKEAKTALKSAVALFGLSNQERGQLKFALEKAKQDEVKVELNDLLDELEEGQDPQKSAIAFLGTMTSKEADDLFKELYFRLFKPLLAQLIKKETDGWVPPKVAVKLDISEPGSYDGGLVASYCNGFLSLIQALGLGKDNIAGLIAKLDDTTSALGPLQNKVPAAKDAFKKIGDLAEKLKQRKQAVAVTVFKQENSGKKTDLTGPVLQALEDMYNCLFVNLWSHLSPNYYRLYFVPGIKGFEKTGVYDSIKEAYDFVLNKEPYMTFYHHDRPIDPWVMYTVLNQMSGKHDTIRGRYYFDPAGLVGAIGEAEDAYRTWIFDIGILLVNQLTISSSAVVPWSIKSEVELQSQWGDLQKKVGPPQVERVEGLGEALKSAAHLNNPLKTIKGKRAELWGETVHWVILHVLLLLDEESRSESKGLLKHPSFTAPSWFIIWKPDDLMVWGEKEWDVYISTMIMFIESIRGARDLGCSSLRIKEMVNDLVERLTPGKKIDKWSGPVPPEKTHLFKQAKAMAKAIEEWAPKKPLKCGIIFLEEEKRTFDVI